MKLISCHIENFGKLSQFDISFEENPYILMEENGWGKSTLATFIKVMFYGFSDETKRNSSEREREKYRPWNKGTYGGRIVFEANHKQYELIKIFGNKEKDDTVELRDKNTNLISKDYTASNIGEELFLIDAASFLRSIYIAQNDCKVHENGKESVSDSISAKIGNLTDATDDVNNYENVQKYLTNILNTLTPHRQTGEIRKLNDKISMLHEEIRQTQTLDATIAENESLLKAEKEKYKVQQEEIDKLRSDFTKAGVLKEKNARKENYLRLCTELKEQREEKEALEAYYKGAIPTEEILDLMLSDAGKMKSLEDAMAENELSKEAEITLNSLEGIFINGVVSRESLQEKRKEVNALNMLIHSDKTEKESLDEEKIRRLNSKYPDGFAETEEINAKISGWNDLIKRQGDISNKRNQLEIIKQVEDEKNQVALLKKQEEARKKQEENLNKTAKKVNLMFIFAALLILTGAGISFIKLAPGIIVVAAGLLVLTGAFVLNLGKEKILYEDDDDYDTPDIIDNSTVYQQTLEALNEEENRIASLMEEFHVFFAKYGIPFSRETALDALYQFKQAGEDYKSLLAKKREYAGKNYEEKIKDGFASLKQYILSYYPGKEVSMDNIDDCFNRLEQDSAQYSLLKERNDKFVTAREKYSRIKDKITAFINEVKGETDKEIPILLQEMKEQIILIARADKELLRREQLKLSYEKEHPVVLSPDTPEEEMLLSSEEISNNMDMVVREMEETEKAIKMYNDRLNELNEKRILISEKELELEGLLIKKGEKEQLYKLVSKTGEYLKMAKENLNTKYTRPVMERFCNYYNKIIPDAAQDFSIDANINLTKIEEGMQRPVTSLSSGYQDFIDICLRFALIDVMYEEEKPFIVLDDPFVNLDEAKIKKAVMLLKEISNSYQIIYFTCHESRM